MNFSDDTFVKIALALIAIFAGFQIKNFFSNRSNNKNQSNDVSQNNIKAGGDVAGRDVIKKHNND